MNKTVNTYSATVSPLIYDNISVHLNLYENKSHIKRDLGKYIKMRGIVFCKLTLHILNNFKTDLCVRFAGEC